MRDRFLGKVYITTAASLWGTLGLVASLAMLDRMTPGSIAFFRALIGFMIGLPLIKSSFLDLRMAKMGLLLVGPLYFSYIYSIKYSGIGIAAALLYLAPTIVTLLSPLLLRERITIKKLIAAILATFGVILTQFKEGLFSPNPLGILLGLMSAFFYAGMIIYVRKLMLYGYDPVKVGASPLIWTSLELLPFFSLRVTLVSLASIVYLGIFTAVIPYILQAKGLKVIEASTASVISTLEPFVALMIGLLMGEPLGLTGSLGALMIITASMII